MNRWGDSGRSAGALLSAIVVLPSRVRARVPPVPRQCRRPSQSATARRMRISFSSTANMAAHCLPHNRYLTYFSFVKSEGKNQPAPISRKVSLFRFDLTDLSVFRDVAEAGSITGGAQRSRLALAAASTRIRNMEEALG